MSRSLVPLRRIMVAAAALTAMAAPATLGPAPPLPVQAAACSQQFLPDPDPACTPGVTDPRVSQDTIQQTICVRGYTRGVRPPVSYTDERKRQGIVDYGYSDTSPADYEEDHLIALELGGSPTDPGNLWPEPRYPTGAGGRTAADKDRVENQLHTRVCAGDVSLAGAQQAIAGDWTTALDRAR
jgi:hypothetical protein